MYCNCGCNQEMARRQAGLRKYFKCVACGRVHWTDKHAKSARKPALAIPMPWGEAEAV